MELEGVGVTQPQKHGPFQLRLKFGRQHDCVIELRRGEEAAEVAKKLRELGDQVARVTWPPECPPAELWGRAQALRAGGLVR